MRPSASALCATALTLLAASRAAGQPAARSDTLKVALSISGGISLGAYQAGVNWALVQTMKRITRDSAFRQRLAAPGRNVSLPRVDLAAVAGASAGNINALLSALSWCDTTNVARAEGSLFWKTWVTTGLPQLFPYTPELEGQRQFRVPLLGGKGPRDLREAYPASAIGGARRDYVFSDTGQALFNRVYFRGVLYPALFAEASAPTHDPRCRIPIGITVTRVVPDTFPVESGLYAAVQRFAAVVELRGGGDPAGGGAPLAFAHAPHELRHGRQLGALIDLYSDSNPYIPTDSVLALVEASSAFPLAFAPRRLKYYAADSLYLDPAGAAPDDAIVKCAALGVRGPCALPRIAQFIDGGVFDNNPVSLALDLLRCRARIGVRPLLGCDRGSEPGGATSAPPPLHAGRVIFINPAAIRPPLRAAPQAQSADTGAGIAAVLRFAGGAVPAARQYELQVLGRHMGELSEVGDTLALVHPTTRAFPIVGTNLSAFAAFLGRPFREHDFYVGVYDGLRYAIREFVCNERTLAAKYPAAARRPIGHGVSRESRLDACTAEELRFALAEDYVPLSPAASHVMHTVFVNEYPGSFPPAVQAVASTADSIETALVASVSDANALSIGARSPGRCTGRDIVHTVLCMNDFDTFLARYGERLRRHPLAGGHDVVARALARRLPGDTTKRCDGAEATAAPDDCLADRVFQEFLDERHHFTNQLILEVLRRQWLVEAAQEKPDSHVAPIELLELWYRSTNERYRSGPLFDPSTIPSYESGVLSLLQLAPFHYTGGIGVTGFGLGWRPTLYLSKLPWTHHFHERLALVFPMDLWKFQATRDAPEPLGYQFNVGPGLYYQGHGFAFSGVQVSVFGGGDVTLRWKKITGDGFSFGRRSLGADVVTSWLGGKIRMGVHRFPTSVRPLVGGKTYAATFGLGDVNGLLYWGLRLLR